MIKQWFTAREIAELALPDCPASEKGILNRASKDTWKSRARQARGGGLEYHISALPQAAQAALVERLVDVDAAALTMHVADEDTAKIDRAALRRDARILILKMLNVFRGMTSLGRVKAMRSFELVYNGRKVEGMPDWVYDTFPRISWQTLHRWSKRKEKSDFSGLAGRYGNRKGTGVLETGLKGQVKAFIVALVIKQPHLTAIHIRDMVRAEFGDMLDGRPR